METCIRTLDQVDAESLADVGGKGANLGELVSAGIPVPHTFCVTTDAYRSFMTENGLFEVVATILSGVDYENPAGIEASASAIRASMLDAPAPRWIVDDIEAAYAALEAELGQNLSVAVRSSATAEDLPGTSFAGQQDTYLHVSGRDRVIDAVKRCWASLWTDRAVAYRHTHGFDHQAVLLGVVVQEMFPAQVSGVLFTANPVTSNPGEFFLNLSWGLGEAVVSGHVNPDQLVVDRQSLAVIDRQVNDKRVMTVRHIGGQGSVEVAVPEDRRHVQALDDDHIRTLCDIGQKIEAHYRFPQDIEWGYADGRFAILQAREVTGANLDFGHELEVWKHPRALADMYDDRWVWSRAYSDEVQTGPSTPSFYTYLQLGMTHLKATALNMTKTPSFLDYTPDTYLHFPYFRWYGARAYYNLAFERERIRLFIPPFARTEAALWPFPREQREEIRNMPFDWGRFLALLRQLHDTNHDISLLGTTEVIYEGLERWTDNEDAFWDGFDLEAADVGSIFAAQLESRTGSRFGQNVILPFTIYLFMLPSALETVCATWLGDEDGQIYSRLVGGLQTKTAEENIAVWELSRSIKASASLTESVTAKDNDAVLASLDADDDGRVFRAELDAFIARYGHRGAAERDAYHPRWRHAPGRVFDAVRPMLALDDHESPQHHEQRLRELMLETKAACVEHLESEAADGAPDLAWLIELNQLTEEPASTRAGLFVWLVELVQDYFYYRDFERFYNDKTMGRSRDLYEAIARRFVRHELLTDPDDVFFLGRDEMLAADRGKLTAQQIAVRVRARRRVYEKYSHQEPPKYIRGWHTFDDDQLDDDGALRGIAASSGTVTGRARVCRDLSEISTIERGDILVTVATDPGWTTVFSMIGGVVVETGGVVAHAVMISREYGLPCVANLSRACDHIPDGATITVDGNTGRVLVHDHPGDGERS